MKFEATTFHAMGTDVEVLAAPSLPADAAEAIRDRFAEMESRFSRFRSDSELSSVNAAAGTPVPASPVFREVLSQALRAAAASGGLFDPLVLADVEAAGYRESFEFLPPSVDTRFCLPRSVDYREVVITPEGMVSIPEGKGIDLGGFVKGWTVDSCEELMLGVGNWVINAGGDLLARGHGPEGNGWIVGVEDPFTRGSAIMKIRVGDGAVATSSIMRRRWWTEGGIAHHLIDPRTGRPSDTDIASVTVVTKAVVTAEVLAKRLLLSGSREAWRVATAERIACLYVKDDGGVTVTPPMEQCLVF